LQPTYLIVALLHYRSSAIVLHCCAAAVGYSETVRQEVIDSIPNIVLMRQGGLVASMVPFRSIFISRRAASDGRRAIIIILYVLTWSEQKDRGYKKMVEKGKRK